SYRLTNPRGVTYFEKFMDERDNEIKEIFVAPPVFWDDIGYTLELKNLSYGPEQTVNDIFSVEYWFVPYNFISSIRQQTDDFNDSLLSNKEKVEVLSKLDWPLPVYRISLDSDRETEQNLIVIDQAYHSDWQAYQPHLFGQKLEHYQYNNWANAWLLPVGIQDLIIIYWPQIFELIGLGLLSFILVYLYVKR
ncbi:MAG: hypothetical protein U9O78_03420, partial [Patescibacteria group bacterium]|nr:hypothetical protein [Patescibacteria group bacterium]